MKQFVFLLAAGILLVTGCQPAPIIINNEDDHCHHDQERPQRPIIIERQQPPIIIERQQPPIIIERQQPPIIIERQQPPIIIEGCTQHRHCGCCPVCRSNGWVTGIGIHIEKGRVGVDINGHQHH